MEVGKDEIGFSFLIKYCGLKIGTVFFTEIICGTKNG
jgi:hypothetical protein